MIRGLVLFVPRLMIAVGCVAVIVACAGPLAVFGWFGGADD